MVAHEVVVETEIAATPERVWNLVTDITLLPRFSTELQSAEWAEGFGGPGPAAQFLGTNRHPAIGEWTTRSYVVDFEVPHSFGWAVGDAENPAATWRFDIEPMPSGSRLRYSARLGDGPSGVTMLIGRDPGDAEDIIARRLAQWRVGMEATLAGIKKLAESA